MGETVDTLIDKLADIVAEDTSLGVGSIVDKLQMALAKRDRSAAIPDAAPSYLVKRPHAYMIGDRDRVELAGKAREMRRQGYTLLEIADALSCSIGWVSYALHKAQYAEGL